MAVLLGNKTAGKQVDKRTTELSKALETFWAGDHYAYRDRDTNVTTTGSVLLENGAGDIEHRIDRSLLAPNRVIVRIIGGVSHTPNVTLHITGLDGAGNAITESATPDKLLWQNRQGIYTTQAVFSRVDSIRCDGLARVYRIDAFTMDTTGIDINAIWPLISGVVPAAKTKQLVSLALDKKHFLRPNGITMTDTATSKFDPTSADGAGGVWLCCQTLLGEALLDAGEGARAADIAKNILKMLQDVLAKEHEFAQFYNSDEPVGLGERGHIAGIAPLLLMQTLFGVRIIGNHKVHLSKDFAWGRSLTIQQHGVSVRRTTKRIKVEFPSGHTVELDGALEEDTVVEDPQPAPMVTFSPIELPEAVQAAIPEPEPPPASSANRVIIEVEQED